jgi:DNA-binding NtrC family response regulator
VEAANGGLLCLDEIGEMPLELQSYLLRVLEDGVVYRVGGHTGHQVALRLVSMTNRDLSGEVAAGRFRKDLFYRIAALRLRIPPLRERDGDVPLLLDHFGALAAARAGLPPPRFTEAARAALAGYGWPGNVRELRNMVDMLVAMKHGDGPVDVSDLPPEVRAEPARPSGASDLKAVEEAAIRAAVDACGGNLSRAARRLGIARSTLYMRLAALEGKGS